MINNKKDNFILKTAVQFFSSLHLSKENKYHQTGLPKTDVTPLSTKWYKTDASQTTNRLEEPGNFL